MKTAAPTPSNPSLTRTLALTLTRAPALTLTLSCTPQGDPGIGAGYFDEVHILYTNFVNTIRQVPVVKKLLPIEPAESTVAMAPEYIIEPSPESVLSQVLYGFTEVQVLQALYESIASEHGHQLLRNFLEDAKVKVPA